MTRRRRISVLAYGTSPLETAKLAGHLLFEMDRSHVSSVMVAGRWVVRDRRVVTVDAARAAAAAQDAARGLWSRMEKV